MTPELQQAVDLDQLGRDAEAQRHYLAYLEQHPDDAEALFHMGNLAFRTRYFRAAMAAFLKAARLRPGDPRIRTKLGNVLLGANKAEAARAEFQAALAADPTYAPAHQGLSNALCCLGQDEASRHHRDLGYRGHAATHSPYRGSGTPVRILVLASGTSGNFNPAWFLDSRLYDAVRIASEYADLDASLPPHDVILNVIGDADRCPEALEAACRLIARPGARAVLNDPRKVALTGRLANADRMRAIAGLRVPRMQAVGRQELLHGGAAALAARGFGFPLLMRSPGHNTGRHFRKVDDPDGLLPALEALPGDPLLVIEFVDLTEPDGYARKYRMIAVDGELFAVHAAVSQEWMIHLYTASSEAVHREEDVRFLADPASVLGAAALGALTEIVRTMGLEYAGVDFGIDSSGQVVLFEANATMSIVPADPGNPRDAYRHAALEPICEAFGRLIARKIATAASA